MFLIMFKSPYTYNIGILTPKVKGQREKKMKIIFNHFNRLEFFFDLI